jgi:hypothetical protein
VPADRFVNPRDRACSLASTEAAAVHNCEWRQRLARSQIQR